MYNLGHADGSPQLLAFVSRVSVGWAGFVCERCVISGAVSVGHGSGRVKKGGKTTTRGRREGGKCIVLLLWGDQSK